jgi:hypothetical protein
MAIVITPMQAIGSLLWPGEFVWSHLSAIVLPEDILKYPMAACSQQSIIMMECFKKIGVDYRKVGFEDIMR